MKYEVNNIINLEQETVVVAEFVDFTDAMSFLSKKREESTMRLMDMEIENHKRTNKNSLIPLELSEKWYKAAKETSEKLWTLTMSNNENLIEIFREYLDSKINDGYTEVMFSKKYGYIILCAYEEEIHEFQDAYVCKTDEEFFNKMIDNYKIDYLFIKSRELGRDEMTENDLSAADKNYLEKQINNFRTMWKKSCNG